MKQLNKSEFVLRGQPIIEINHKKVEEMLCDYRTQMFMESSESGEELRGCMSHFFKQALKKPEVLFAHKVCLVIEIPVVKKFSPKEIDVLTDFMSGFEQSDLDINYGIYYVKGQPNYTFKLLV